MPSGKDTGARRKLKFTDPNELPDEGDLGSIAGNEPVNGGSTVINGSTPEGNSGTEHGNTGTTERNSGTEPGAIFGDRGNATNDGGNTGDSGSAIKSEPSDDWSRNPDGSIRRNKDGSPARKRGRKSGSSDGTQKTTSKISVSGIESLLLSIHTMGAAVLKAPEIELTQGEAAQMAVAMAEVAKHYPIELDPKIMAWANLATCSAMVYGPRVYMIRKRIAEENDTRRKEMASRGLPGPDKGPIIADGLRQGTFQGT